ncbi:unnamed protein product, partial [Coregonus sp. 'balchen']
KLTIQPRTLALIHFVKIAHLDNRSKIKLKQSLYGISQKTLDRMAADWLGSLVSINCGEALGVYQGEVSSVDQSSQTISLRQPFHNGVKCPVPEVTFSAMDIKELKVLDIVSGRGGVVQKISAPVSVPHRGHHRTQERLASPQQQCSKSSGDKHLEVPGQPKGFRRRHNSWSSSSRGANQVTPKKNGVKNGGGGQRQHRDDECFGDNMDDGLDTDFDFEGNLALFDKAAVFSQIDGSDRRGNGARSHGTPQEQTSSQYRHDKNILETKPVVLTPKNVHQQPTVALLCGPHVQGAQGISCARHLANHEVEVILFLPNFVKVLDAVASELNLYTKTEGKQVSVIQELPDSPVDLIINCLDCHENALIMDQPWYQAAADWANQNRAPVLSLDPPVGGQGHAVEAKWTLSLGLPLPLSEDAGRVYLCDIGVPRQVFQEVGIKYHSPFGCKFVVPLHSA